MKKTQKALGLTSIVVGMALAVTACSEGDPGAGEATAGGELDQIGMTVQDLSNPFFQSMVNGVEARASELGATVNVQDGRQDLGAQSDQIDAFIQQGVDVVLLNAVDSEGIGPAVDRAREAGIVVVAVDVSARGAQATVTLDNVQAGEFACEYLVDQIGGAGDILIVDGRPISSIQDRVEGCENVLAEHPDVRVVGQQNGDNGRALALTLTTDMLTANPDVKGIFGVNDPTALGANLAAEQAGFSDLVIVGVDASPEGVSELEKAGSMFQASPKQDPNTQGSIALDMAVELFNGGTLDDDVVLVETELITRENLADYAGWQ